MEGKYDIKKQFKFNVRLHAIDLFLVNKVLSDDGGDGSFCACNEPPSPALDLTGCEHHQFDHAPGDLAKRSQGSSTILISIIIETLVYFFTD